MPAINIYDAAGEFLRSQKLDGKAPVGVVERPPEGDPVRLFEGMNFQVQSDLRGWTTIPVKNRLARVGEVSYVPELTEDATDEERLNHKQKERQRWIALNFIIQEESRSSLGNREVAMNAFNRLFPQETPAKKA